MKNSGIIAKQLILMTQSVSHSKSWADEAKGEENVCKGRH